MYAVHGSLVVAAVSAASVPAAAVVAGQCALMATVMAGRTCVSMTIARFVAVEVVEGLSSALG
jgi:hypothetical protein